MRHLAIVLVLLVGCATGLTASDKLRLACESYNSTVVVLAGLRAAGKLTPADIMAVDRSIVISDPLCRGGAVVSADDALSAVETLLVEMRKVQAQHGR